MPSPTSMPGPASETRSLYPQCDVLVLIFTVIKANAGSLQLKPTHINLLLRSAMFVNSRGQAHSHTKLFSLFRRISHD